MLLVLQVGDQAHDLGDVDEAVAAAHLQRRHAGRLHALAGDLQHRLAGHHGPAQFLAGRLQARRRVDGVADRRGFLVLDRAQAADGDFARMKPYADGERRQAAVAEAALQPGTEFVRGQCHRERGRDGTTRRRQGRAADRVRENRHQPVADEFDVAPAVGEHRLAGALEVGGEQFRHFGRTELLGQRREIADVGEQHRGLHHLVGHRAFGRLQPELVGRALAAQALGERAPQQFLALLDGRSDRFLDAPLALQQGAQRFEQFHPRERLGEIVVGARRHAAAHAGAVVQRRQHHHRRGRQQRVGADRLQQGEAVHLRHADVADHHVRPQLPHLLQAFAPIHRQGRVVAFQLQQPGDVVADRVVVFDDQDGGHGETRG